MRYYRTAGLAVLLSAIVIFAGVKAVAYQLPAPTPPAPELSVVRVDTTGGHGSGVNIGHGFIITAGHVASTEANVSIRKADGTTATAEVLWVNKTYDVALLRTTNDIGQGSDIDCGTPPIGTQVEASGNPMTLEFISTYGRVAGIVREVGPWKEALPVNISIGSGMSGGPLFALDGRIVGIVVGGALDHVKTGVDSAGAASFSYTNAGIAMIVPSSTVCRLMGRGEGV